MPFPIGGPLEPASITNSFRDIQWRMWRNDEVIHFGTNRFLIYDFL